MKFSTAASMPHRNGCHQAVIAPLAYLGITALEGQVITPTLIGHRLTINPFLVFLSIAFWTWMWGPVGTFLGCAHSLVRDGGDAPAIDRPRECRPTRDRLRMARRADAADVSIVPSSHATDKPADTKRY
jgi:hypothetical protein